MPVPAQDRLAHPRRQRRRGLPAGDFGAVLVDQARLDLRRRPELFDHAFGQRDATHRGRAFDRHVNDVPRTRMFHRMHVGIVPRQLHQRVGGPRRTRLPCPALRRLHVVDHVGEHRLDQRTVHVGQPGTGEAEHPGGVVPPGVHPPPPASLPRRFLRRRARGTNKLVEIRRRGMARPVGPLRIRVLIRESRRRYELLGAHRPRMCRFGQTRQLLERPRRGHGVAPHARTDTPSATAIASSTAPRSSNTATTASSSTRNRRCSATSSDRRAASHSLVWQRSSSNRSP